MTRGRRRGRRSRRSRRPAGSARRVSRSVSTIGAGRTPASRIRPRPCSSDRLTTTRCPASSAVQVHATRCSHDRLSAHPSTVDRRPRPAPHPERQRRPQPLVPGRQVACRAPPPDAGRASPAPAPAARPPGPRGRSATPGSVRATTAAARVRRGEHRRGAAARRGSRRSARCGPGTPGSAARCSRTDDAGSPVHEPVVEALVVAGVEALLDEARLEVPVGLGPEREAGVPRPHRADDRRPVAPTAVGRRRRPAARSPHVRTKTSSSTSIAMSQRTPSHRSAIDSTVAAAASRTSGPGRVELQHLGPGREVRVAATRDHRVADGQEAGRVGGEVVGRAAHEPLRVLRAPTGGRARRGWARSRGRGRRRGRPARRAPRPGRRRRRGARRRRSRGCSTPTRRRRRR